MTFLPPCQSLQVFADQGVELPEPVLEPGKILFLRRFCQLGGKFTGENQLVATGVGLQEQAGQVRFSGPWWPGDIDRRRSRLALRPQLGDCGMSQLDLGNQ